MNRPVISIELDGENAPFLPGGALSGEYRIDVEDRQAIRSLELSVLWYTSGQGEEDLAVHDFRRYAMDEEHADQPRAGDFRTGGRFRTVLPMSPLTYDGILVKVHWCVRIRIFLAHGREVVEEHSFRMGHVPPAKIMTA